MNFEVGQKFSSMQISIKLRVEMQRYHWNCWSKWSIDHYDQTSNQSSNYADVGL